MKQIYLTSIGLLSPEVEPVEAKELAIYNQLKKIRWVDMDKGQLEFYDTRPAVPFPCALVKVEISKTEDMGNGIQRCYGRVIVRLAFNYVGETSNLTPEATRLQSLDYFDLVEAVYLGMQGKAVGKGKFDRQSAVEENRPDGLKVIAVPFAASWLDTSAAKN
jgi:hypothetical protein